MESNRRRKGFGKGKLVMSFYRAGAAKLPSSTTLQYGGSKVKPSHPISSTASSGFIINQDRVIPQPTQKIATSTASVGFIVNQDYQGIPQPNQKVSYVIQDNDVRDSYGMFDNHSYGVAGDESVDVKTASYISYVQERFRLERANSEHKKSQEILN